MINLKVFKVRLTRPIPRKFREVVEDAIWETYLQKIMNATFTFHDIIKKSEMRDKKTSLFGSKRYDSESSARHAWRVVYQPWYGFVLKVNDTFRKPYAHIVNWINYGTESKGKIMAKRSKFMIFPEDPNFVYDKNRKGTGIPGNISFTYKGFVFTKFVRHKGVREKRFVEDVVEDVMVYNNFYHLVSEHPYVTKWDIDEQLHLLNNIDYSFIEIKGLSYS